jgi:hypothetical protein
MPSDHDGCGTLATGRAPLTRAHIGFSRITTENGSSRAIGMVIAAVSITTIVGIETGGETRIGTTATGTVTASAGDEPWRR